VVVPCVRKVLAWAIGQPLADVTWRARRATKAVNAVRAAHASAPLFGEVVAHRQCATIAATVAAAMAAIGRVDIGVFFRGLGHCG
jgi:mono/diheme cytochrome c family protein